QSYHWPDASPHWNSRAERARGYRRISRWRPCDGRALHLRGQPRIRGKEVWRQADEGGGIVDRQWLVSNLALAVAQKEKTVAFDGAAQSAAELLPAVVRLGDTG